MRRRSPLRWNGSVGLAAVIALVLALLAARARGAGAETIESALARAYENNPQLNAQRAIVRQTDESVPQALSGYRPTITANATVGRQYTDIHEIIPPTPGLVPAGAAFSDTGLTTPYSVGATATQTFFNGEQTANSVRPPKARSPRRARRCASWSNRCCWRQRPFIWTCRATAPISRSSRIMSASLSARSQDTRNRFTAGQVTDHRRRAVGGAIGGRPRPPCMPPSRR